MNNNTTKKSCAFFLCLVIKEWEILISVFFLLANFIWGQSVLTLQAETIILTAQTISWKLLKYSTLRKTENLINVKFKKFFLLF